MRSDAAEAIRRGEQPPRLEPHIVFGLLDFYIKTGPGGDALWPTKVAKAGVPILVGGILIKVLLVGDKKP